MAGLVALIISANPVLAGQVDTIKAIIEQTAVPKTTGQNCGDILGAEVPNHTYGYGRVDALAAVEAAIALIPVSAVQEQLPLAVRLFPNPVGDQLNIVVENSIGDVQFELFDPQGRLMLQRCWNKGTRFYSSLDLTASLPGFYFYRMTNGGRVLQGKLVKL